MEDNRNKTFESKKYCKNNEYKGLYEQLLEYEKEDYYPFHMPGHKRNSEMISMIDPYKIDITEIDNFDNLHKAESVILNLMKQISRMYGTKKSYILVNGSTCGIMAAISGVVREGDNIVISRNCHKSVYNAVFINRLKCTYLKPNIDKYGIFEDIKIEEIKEVFEKKADIKAVVITSPTYEGIVSDIDIIAEYVHERGAILIVDEAHGAHFKFDSYFPKSAVELGADIVIESIHKTLPAMTQTSILHICSDRVDSKRVEKYLGIYESSSPSYVLMSSIEKCMNMLEASAEKLFSEYTNRIERIYSECSKLKRLFIYKPMEVFDFDRGKINIVSIDDKYTGMDLYNELLNKYHLQMEMASSKYVIAMTSICDTDYGINRLINALKEIDLRLENTSSKICDKVDNKVDNKVSNKISNETINTKIIIPEKKLDSYEADGEEQEEILFVESEGKISGTFVYLYPPGCPVLVPGEIISKEMIEKISSYIREGLNVTGLNNDKIMVVNNNKIK